MKLAPSKIGAQPKQIAILGLLVVVLGIVFWLNHTPDGPQAAAPSVTPASSANPPANPGASARAGSGAPSPETLTPMPPQRGGALSRGQASIQDFKPTLKLPEGTDISRIDPSLKLDLMAALQNTPLEGGERSLFEFGAEPKPPLPHVNPVKPPPLPIPAPVVNATPPPPVKPAPPPIPLKFYGYVSESEGPAKRAFFLDGDDIVVAAENDTIRNRYKIIRIGVNSAVVEDVTTKNQQTLPLVEELPG
jgi:hypothetical protein